MTEHNGAPADLKRTITVKDRAQLSVGPDIIGPDIVALRFTVRGFNPYDAAIKELNSCVEAPRRDLEAEKVRERNGRRPKPMRIPYIT